jgi:hypothetical protein
MGSIFALFALDCQRGRSVLVLPGRDMRFIPSMSVCLISPESYVRMDHPDHLLPAQNATTLNVLVKTRLVDAFRENKPTKMSSRR